MPTEVAIPFRLDETGQIVNVSTLAEITGQHAMSLASTNLGERVIVKDYGTDLSALLFDDVDAISGEIQHALTASFANWEQGIKLSAINVGVDENNVASVDITYSVTDDPQDDSPSNSGGSVYIGLGGQVTRIIR